MAWQIELLTECILIINTLSECDEKKRLLHLLTLYLSRLCTDDARGVQEGASTTN